MDEKFHHIGIKVHIDDPSEIHCTGGGGGGGGETRKATFPRSIYLGRQNFLYFL